MSLPIQQIAEGVCHNTTPHIEDGMSNLERLQFVLQVFQLEEFSLTEKFPLEDYLDSDHMEELVACRFICQLKHSFNWALYLNGNIPKTDCEIFTGYLQLMAMKFLWNINHFGHEIRPPFNFLN